MNILEENKNIKDEVDIALLHSSEADSVEVIMDLAVYGLAAMTDKHNNTPIEQVVLQVSAGHMRKLLDALPKTEGLVKTEKNYRRLENLIFKTYLPKQ